MKEKSRHTENKLKGSNICLEEWEKKGLREQWTGPAE
jgi:hypothetical protein